MSIGVMGRTMANQTYLNVLFRVGEGDGIIGWLLLVTVS
jgi:hypothetical protein